ncbi:putative membrane protein [Brevibacillus phage Abouo]|uniref:Putative membrane protein n=1 Tax=Brevibacillus phage Abouo TaxID=1296661 RepID=S5M638_9CAUD|nr:membrane protein [Brevibacillus phage Abouo]AGR47481.1 putative membrane protein [Brevibacillus phage Abouo]
MDILLYLALGYLDQMAIIILTFKMFRFPVRAYFREFSIIAVVLSLISYVDRIVFDIPQYDTGIQYIVLILFFRYMLGFRFFEAAATTAAGCLSFIGIQFIAYYLLMQSNIISANILGQFQAFGTYLLQILSDLLVFFIAWMIQVLNVGYSFIIQPPHNLAYKTKMTTLNVLIICAIILTAFVLISFSYVLIMTESKPYVILAYVIIPVVILLWLLRKRDYHG